MNVLVCYGSLREDSDSKKLALEVEKKLIKEGLDVTVYDPEGLPLFDYVSGEHPKCVELFNLAKWANGMVWISPEYHGGTSGVMKNIIDWIPSRDRAEGSTKGKPLGLVSCTGGAQSFNTINSMNTNGRWLKMLTLPTHVNWAHPWLGMDKTLHERLGQMCTEMRIWTELEPLQ